MFNINELYDGDQLLEGRYRLLKRLSEDGTLGLAVDTAGVANYLSNGEHNYAIDESSCPQVIIRFNLPKNTSDIKGEEVSNERLSDDECKGGQEYYHLNQSQPAYSSTYNSFSGEKVSYDVFSFSTKVSSKLPFPRKPLYITLVVICLLLLGGGSYYHFKNIKPIYNPVPMPEPPVTPLPTFEHAEVLLDNSNNDSVAAGLKMLDTLIKMGDYRAQFLMSRLYFEPGGKDRMDAMETQWRKMRKNCKTFLIRQKSNNNTDDDRQDKQQLANKMAHDMLYNAFKQWENSKDRYNDDYKIFYYLGCDYMAGEAEKHGITRNQYYALWCFEKADSLCEGHSEIEEAYSDDIERKTDGLRKQKVQPQKPNN